MTQHGEKKAVVPGLSARLKRGLRSAACATLSAGLALTFVAATALPLVPLRHIPPLAIVASAAAGAAHAAAPISGLPSRPLRQPIATPLTGASASKLSPENAANTSASGIAASASSLASPRVTEVATTPAQRLLRFGTRASRTRGQPDQG